MKEYEGSRSINVFWQSSMDVVRFDELDSLVAPPANSDYTPALSSSRSLATAGPEALARYPAEAFRVRDWFLQGGAFQAQPLDVEVFGAEASADPTIAWANCINPPANPPRLQLPPGQFVGSSAQRWERSVRSLQRMQLQAPERPAFEVPVELQQVYDAGKRSLARRSASLDLHPPPRPQHVAAQQPARITFPPFPSSSSSSTSKQTPVCTSSSTHPSVQQLQPAPQSGFEMGSLVSTGVLTASVAAAESVPMPTESFDPPSDSVDGVSENVMVLMPPIPNTSECSAVEHSAQALNAVVVSSPSIDSVGAGPNAPASTLPPAQEHSSCTGTIFTANTCDGSRRSSNQSECSAWDIA